MASVTTNFGFDVPTSSDLVKNGATQIALLGQDIDTFLYGSPTYAAAKNKIYNGSMLIAQRGTSFTGISGTTAVNVTDRWQVFPQNLGTVTATQDTTIPTGAGVGQSLKLACTTADAAPSANTRLRVITRFEGIDVQDLNYGSASAKPLTLSFWVRSSKTGTYIVEFWTTQTSSNKHICASYTIAAANTWQQVKITIAGDTASNIINTTSAGFDVYFYLAAGSDYTSGTLATSWAAPVTANRAVGQVNWADSNTATFYMTAVQLEVGSTATTFSLRGGSVQGELASCQRYYYRANWDAKAAYPVFAQGGGYSTTNARLTMPFPVNMRVQPTAIDTSAVANMRLQSFNDATSIAPSALTFDSNFTTTTNGFIGATVASGLTANALYYLRGEGSTAYYIGWSAEF
jgi:hypothetical protein